MERFEKPPTNHRHRRNNPSFSSSLLDAIYRSIDDSDANLTGGAPDPISKHKLPPKAVTRLSYSSAASTSSSDSFSGFSSSDADSARLPRSKPPRTGPILTRSDRIRADPPPDPNPKKIPISIKKKLRDLKKSTSPKLAGFINSIFTASNHKKAKIATPAMAESPSQSTSSSCSRSCLSKTPSTHGGGKRSERSVRFCPVGVIVGEDCRPCGEKFVFDGALAEVTVAAERRKKAVEELMKGFEMEEESGDESEDLFELENLGGRFWDELPVYETTDLGINSAIAKGLVV